MKKGAVVSMAIRGVSAAIRRRNAILTGGETPPFTDPSRRRYAGVFRRRFGSGAAGDPPVDRRLPAIWEGACM